jgi:hypothetical protein
MSLGGGGSSGELTPIGKLELSPTRADYFRHSRSDVHLELAHWMFRRGILKSSPLDLLMSRLSIGTLHQRSHCDAGSRLKDYTLTLLIIQSSRMGVTIEIAIIDLRDMRSWEATLEVRLGYSHPVHA